MASKRKKKKIDQRLWIAGGVVALIVIAAAIALFAGEEIVTIPFFPNITGPEQPLEICNYDGVCDNIETRESCPEDCIEPQALSANRSEETPITHSMPVLEILMESGTGVASCGSGTADSSQWECVVQTPGATSTMVHCTLQNYYFDGSYMLALRCKDNNNDDLPMQLIDDTNVCADPVAGCGRWL